MKRRARRLPGTFAWAPLSARQLEAWSRACAPQEACGLCFAPTGARWPRDAARFLVTRCANTAPEAARAFSIDGLESMRQERAMRARGFEICGFWHSHPRGAAALSARDRSEIRRLSAPARWIYPVVGHAASDRICTAIFGDDRDGR